MHPYCLTPRFLCWGCHNYVYFVERLRSLHRNYLSPKGIGRSDLGGIIPTGITLIIGASYWSLIVVIKNAVRASTQSRSLQSVCQCTINFYAKLGYFWNKVVGEKSKSAEVVVLFLWRWRTTKKNPADSIYDLWTVSIIGHITKRVEGKGKGGYGVDNGCTKPAMDWHPIQSTLLPHT